MTITIETDEPFRLFPAQLITRRSCGCAALTTPLDSKANLRDQR
ncbi:MAG: hypothetical protein QM695_15215 [Micropruina sp.]